MNTARYAHEASYFSTNSNKMPLYQHVKNEILQNIATGVWDVARPLPNEKDLSTLFSVSIGTLRKAVDELITNGMLVRQQGRGTFVAKHNANRYLFHFFHIVAKNGDKDFPRLQLLEATTLKSTKNIASGLHIAPGDPVLRLKNLLHLQHKPVILDILYLPISLFPDLTEAMIFNRSGTLYQLYQEQCNVSIMRIGEQLSATVATADQAHYLGVEQGAPLLHITRTAYTITQQVAEVRYSFCNTANHNYAVTHFG